MKQTNIDKPKGVKIAKVKSVKYVGKSDVYNLEVDGTHNFIANGIIIHNCRYAVEDYTRNNTMVLGYNRII